MEQKGLNWHVDMKIMADWELAEINAWMDTYNIPLLGCLFHLGGLFLQ